MDVEYTVSMGYHVFKMPITSEELLIREAEEQARADLFVERNEQANLELIDQLLTDDTIRDEEIFELVGAPIDETIQDYEIIEVEARDLQWVAGLSALIVASRLQAFVSHREELFDLFAAREKALVGVDIKTSELKKAAEKGISKSTIAAKKAEQIGSIEVAKAPRSELLKAFEILGNADFLEEMVEQRMLPTWNTMQIEASGSASRMMEYPAGSTQWKSAVSNTVQSEARNGMTGLTRRATQQYTTVASTGGNDDTKMIWIVEGDAGTCDQCKPRAAEIRTYGQWKNAGLPGAAVCLGGNRCRCDLFPV